MLNMRLLIVLATVCLAVQVCVQVEGRYLVEVRLDGYTNPTGGCQDCRCCDGKSFVCTGSNLCDSYFIYCLRPFGDARQPPVGCSRSSNEYRNTSSINTDDGHLNFSEGTVLGLNNPQILSGLEDPYEGVQVYIEIRDDDGGNDNKLIDLLLIDHNLPVAESLQQNHTGIYNLVTMNLTITVFCVPGFTGPDCNETDHCFGVNCSGNGECSMDGMGTFHCACNPDFTGELCQTNIDDCVDVDCSGNGLCMDGMGTFHCACNPDFTGELCQTNIDDCVDVDCSGNGLCMDGLNNFTCDCVPGFSGPLCNEVIPSTSGPGGSDSTVSYSTASTSGGGDIIPITVDNDAGGAIGTDGDRSAGTDNAGSTVGAIAGGVVGALLSVVILLTLIITILLVIKRKKNNRQGIDVTLHAAGDNPIYLTSSAVNGGLSSQTTPAAVTTAANEREDTESSRGEEERRFDDFIYGDKDEIDQQDQQSLPSHEFDNPIY